MGVKRIALDLCCGQGGTTAGLLAAGFDEVVGVDLVDHSARYPGTFVQGDALEFLRKWGHQFRFKIAGVPCQGYSIATAGNLPARAKYQKLIAAVRYEFGLVGGDYVIENVEQARSQMLDPVLLCGRMFGLEADDEDGERLVLDRHRLFETNWGLTVPAHPAHDGRQVAGVYGGSRRAKRLPDESLAHVAPRDRYAARYERKGGYVPRSVAVQRQLLGIDWMTVRGMQESIPPVYAEHIGRQWLERQAAA